MLVDCWMTVTAPPRLSIMKLWRKAGTCDPRTCEAKYFQQRQASIIATVQGLWVEHRTCLMFLALEISLFRLIAVKEKGAQNK